MKTIFLTALLCAAALCLYGCDNSDSDSSYENTPDDANELEDVCELIPDDYFREYCLSNFDTNNDGKLSQSEADAVKQMSIIRARGSVQYSSMKVDFSGIEYFRNLEYFESNAAWESFDMSKNSHVSYLALYYSGVTDVILRNTNISSLADGAFYYCSSLTSIELPERLTLIGEKAFFDCTSLTSIELPDELASIGKSAFAYCKKLTSIELPNGLTSIENEAFSGCTRLTHVEFPNGLTSIEGYAFYECTSLTSIELPEGITSIKGETFALCTSLTSVKLPGGLTSIGTDAFYNCTSLASIELPEKLTSIGSSAFYKCSNLVNMTVKAITPPSLGSNAFPNTGKSDRVLYVPSESVDLYKESDWKSYFSDIRAIEE